MQLLTPVQTRELSRRDDEINGYGDGDIERTVQWMRKADMPDGPLFTNPTANPNGVSGWCRLDGAADLKRVHICAFTPCKVRNLGADGLVKAARYGLKGPPEDHVRVFIPHGSAHVPPPPPHTDIAQTATSAVVAATAAAPPAEGTETAQNASSSSVAAPGAAATPPAVVTATTDAPAPDGNETALSAASQIAIGVGPPPPHSPSLEVSAPTPPPPLPGDITPPGTGGPSPPGSGASSPRSVVAEEPAIQLSPAGLGIAPPERVGIEPIVGAPPSSNGQHPPVLIAPKVSVVAEDLAPADDENSSKNDGFWK